MPLVTVNAWSRSVTSLKPSLGSSLKRSSKVKSSCPSCDSGASWMAAVSGDSAASCAPCASRASRVAVDSGGGSSSGMIKGGADSFA